MEKGNGLEDTLGDTQSLHKPTEVAIPNKKQHLNMHADRLQEYQC